MGVMADRLSGSDWKMDASSELEVFESLQLSLNLQTDE